MPPRARLTGPFTGGAESHSLGAVCSPRRSCAACAYRRRH